MTLTLPTLPRQTDYTMRPVVQGEVLRAATGGARLPVSFLGDHWAVEIDTGTMALLCARGLVFDILTGASRVVRVPIPEPGVDKGAPGAAVVDGDGQAGSFLNLRGLTPHTVLRKGWFVTVISAAGARAYMLGPEVVAGADGTATVDIWPMLHVDPADGDRVEILEPFLEGLVDEGGEHSTGIFPTGEPGSFLVEEEW